MFVGVLVMASLVATAGQGAAAADRGFVAQARAAGLSAEHAATLQAKVDDYLVKLGGRGRQVSPNQIDMNGAMLHVAVPGEERPRRLVRATRAEYDVVMCYRGAPYKWFCAYTEPYFYGDYIAMYDCVTVPIPYVTTGSWDNNQTPGTAPLLTFTNGSQWVMPAAYSNQKTGVNWFPVRTIKPC
jgi:hypothetical protein